MAKKWPNGKKWSFFIKILGPQNDETGWPSSRCVFEPQDTIAEDLDPEIGVGVRITGRYERRWEGGVVHRWAGGVQSPECLKDFGVVRLMDAVADKGLCRGLAATP